MGAWFNMLFNGDLMFYREGIPSNARDNILAELLPRQSFRCVICNKVGTDHIDHRIPLSRGGSNDIDNLQALCAACNIEKSDKLVGTRLDGCLFFVPFQLDSLKSTFSAAACVLLNEWVIPTFRTERSYQEMGSCPHWGIDCNKQYSTCLYRTYCQFHV